MPAEHPLEIDKPDVEAFRVAFGRNLRSLRLARGLSQEQSSAYVFELIHWLAAWGTIHNQGMRWQARSHA